MMKQVNDIVSLTRDGSIAVVCIDNPPVNAISSRVVAGLSSALDAFDADRSLAGMLVTCAGRTFVAGGDIAAFEAPAFSAKPFNAVLARLEALDRPVVAALRGTVLGGGLELAMACHWRVADDTTRFGMPEVKLGLMPGSLGTQRLPRLVGLDKAFDMISAGRMMTASEALASGLVDELAAAPLHEAGKSFLKRLVDAGTRPKRTGERMVDAGPLGALTPRMEAVVHAKPAYPAFAAIAKALHAAATQPFAVGEEVEAGLFEELLRSPQSRALRHLFFAERGAAKLPGQSAGSAVRAIARVGVLGAGTMGTGIAMNFLNAGIDTVIVERSPQALEKGVTAIRSTYEGAVAKGRLAAGEMQSRMARLEPRLDDAALGDCDLVIEAVFEDMALKKQVLARLGALCKPGAIIATNTSTLDVDQLAQASGRPGEVVGMHFFSPANIMRLLEVVRGARTDPDVLATVMQLARRIGKVAVVSGVCYGFIGNRMAEVYMREAEFLLMEGATPAQVDAAVEAIGMAMGPFRMLDMAGIDVGAKTVIEYGKAGGLPPDPSYRAVVRSLFESGRHGQKTGAGYYRYEGRKPLPDPKVDSIVQQLANEHGIGRRADIGQQEIFERLLYPMVNEGAKILEEGIAFRGGDIDVVWTAGYGFPDHRGGPLCMADEVGLGAIVDRMDHYAALRGNGFGYWTVSPLLRRLAQQGGRLTGWPAHEGKSQ